VLLEGYFLAGNINKSNRYTAQDMHNKLVQYAQEGEITVEEVPKLPRFKTELVITYENTNKRLRQENRIS
jgi:N-acetyl-beta-hexosaminidase